MPVACKKQKPSRVRMETPAGIPTIPVKNGEGWQHWRIIKYED